MKRLILFLVFLLPMSLFGACSNNVPTEQQMFKAIKNDTIIAKNDFLELKTVSVLSSSPSRGDSKFVALLKIDFINHHETVTWNGQGEKDFIPVGTVVVKGMNSVTVTATFNVAYAGDGSWYAESFAF